jgi:YhcH/YjgK/YiaL family protein
MIFDLLQNRGFYRGWHSQIADALEYLANADFTVVPDGKYELDGRRMFAIVQRYRPKPLENIAWEAHRKYIDVQYIAAGAERMGWTPLDPVFPVTQIYDPERDIAFYDARGDLFTVTAGRFVVFAPHDLHAPGLVLDPPAEANEVLKVVVKCLMRR